MDSRAKQRLTGAVILVALFVLLVPELLTGPRVADAPEGSPTDEGMRRYTIDLDASAPSAQHDNAAAQPPVVLPPVADDRAQPGEAATPAAQAAPESAASAPAVAPRSEPQKPPVPSQPVPTQSAPTSAATPAPTQAPPPAARGSFAVQLGTFGNRENADRLVRDMNAKGFAAFVAPYTKENHELYRVRVGPARDRAAAEALAAQLRRIGQSGSIVPIS
jgi:DedD protein